MVLSYTHSKLESLHTHPDPTKPLKSYHGHSSRTALTLKGAPKGPLKHLQPRTEMLVRKYSVSTGNLVQVIGVVREHRRSVLNQNNCF